MKLLRFPFYKQLDAMDCGPTCLRIIAKYYGKEYSLNRLREYCLISREGVSLLGLSQAAEQIGFKSLAVQVSYDNLEKLPLPVIIHWRDRHFVVVYKIVKDKIFISDPAHGLITYQKQDFLDQWIGGKAKEVMQGVVLLLEPTDDFHAIKNDRHQSEIGFRYLLSYLKDFKKPLIYLFTLTLLGSLFQVILPFISQAVIDRGIKRLDIEFIYLMLIAQVVLFSSKTISDFQRNWILLRVGTRISIVSIYDFLGKLMRLPISFFDSRLIGDILQRLTDHNRVQSFLTSTTLSAAFSIFSLVLLSTVLLMYSPIIFLVFISGSAIYLVWLLFFMKRRKELDYKLFNQFSANQSNLIQLISGMQEIKLNNCEDQKRDEWKHIQEKIYQISVQNLQIANYQQGGGEVINEFKNIFISFLAARQVVDGNISLGVLVAIQYIIGQLDGPLYQLVELIRSVQDTNISLERLSEIQTMEDEDAYNDDKVNVSVDQEDINISDLSFRYPGPRTKDVLKNLNLRIPNGKVTAIVGTSGSGKTTLLKLLLKFYLPTHGTIKLGEVDLYNINSRSWRKKCGVVMQDGYIFSDTVAKNIALGEDKPEAGKLMEAASIANIDKYIETLPLGYDTKIGAEGLELSKGQKQRILIARAVYKNPDSLFLDEATNALDANNESAIVKKLDSFFKGKTVVVIAHRLSTVKNADQIIVIDNGQIVEVGNHKELTELRGFYYQLIRNQLELGL